MKSAAYCLAGGLLAVALATGCGRKSAEAHSEGEGHQETGGVAFKPGRGLTLNSDVIKALSLKTAEAEERPLAAEARWLAQVFARSPQVLASASVTEAEAERLEKQSFIGAKLARIDRGSAAATRRVDAVFSLDREPAPQPGEFIEIRLASESRTALSVARSAVLDAAAGTFVYVVNGKHYLRTPVKLGVRSGDFVEITDGLYAGDVVVTTAVNQLWLSELRLTKGGGHSH